MREKQMSTHGGQYIYNARGLLFYLPGVKCNISNGCELYLKIMLVMFFQWVMFQNSHPYGSVPRSKTYQTYTQDKGDVNRALSPVANARKTKDVDSRFPFTMRQNRLSSNFHIALNLLNLFSQEDKPPLFGLSLVIFETLIFCIKL